MGMGTVRRLSAEIMHVGENRVKFAPDGLARIDDALTREDVRELIKDGLIRAEAKMGVSRIRGRKKQAQLRKGRRFGKGSKKGTPSARLGSKKRWISKVRSQRRYLRGLVQGGKLAKGASRKIYLMIKGNAFKGVKMLETHLKENKLMKK